MSSDNPTVGLQAIRGTDSNSLLRLLDGAILDYQTTGLQLARERARKLVQRIVKELDRRKIALPANANLPADLRTNH